MIILTKKNIYIYSSRPSPRKNKNIKKGGSEASKKNESKSSSTDSSSSSVDGLSHQEETDVNDGSSKVGMVSHAIVTAEQAVVHALRDEVDVLFNDKDHMNIPSSQEQAQTVSSSSSLSSIISIGRSRRSIKKSNEHSDVDHSPHVSRSRNQFGWGLHQSSGVF